FSRILGNAMIRSLAQASGSSSTLRPRLFRNAAGSPQGKVYTAGTDQRDARDILATEPGVLEFTRYARVDDREYPLAVLFQTPGC
ncbi:MAG: hypothetical protein M3Y93_11985, partial [Pseudomonadota bacterium]|nr:hypothetical protein [Pseudomonadota bacterium]